MKRFLLVIFSVIVAHSSIGQTIYLEKLESLTKVWGFLKYNGKYSEKIDWDTVLTNSYSNIGVDSSCVDLRLAINKMISYCHLIRRVQNTENVEINSLPIIRIIGVIDDTLLTQDQKYKLIEISNLKRKTNSKYISSTLFTKTPQFIEKISVDSSLSMGEKYLGISRLWAALNYYYPYEEIYANNWERALYTCLESIIHSIDYEDYYYAVKLCGAFLHDAHFRVSTPHFSEINNFKYPPFWYRFIDMDKMVVSGFRDDSLCKSKGISIGDEIIRINDIPVHTIVEEANRYRSIPNSYYNMRTNYFVLKTKESESKYTFFSQNKTSTITLENRYLGKYSKDNLRNERSSEAPVEMLDRSKIKGNKNATLLRMNVLSNKDLYFAFNRMNDSPDFIILDFRKYPNWTLHKLGKLLLAKNTFAEIYRPDLVKPRQKYIKEEMKIGKNSDEFKGSIIILVDFSTISRGEYMAMAFQTHSRAVTIGGQTAGSDGDITSIVLPGNIEVLFSGQAVTYPGKVKCKEEGLKIDIPVTTNPFDFEKDYILERALQYIENQ